MYLQLTYILKVCTLTVACSLMMHEGNGVVPGTNLGQKVTLTCVSYADPYHRIGLRKVFFMFLCKKTR